jgi:hypothetical protein
MRVRDMGRLAMAAPTILSGHKSFVGHPVIGDQALNAAGLHRWRVATAAALSQRRRRAIARRIAPQDAAALDRDGFVMKRDYLPTEEFHAIRDAVFAGSLPAREMRQGAAVTRMTPISAPALASLRAMAARREIADLMGYAAGRSGSPAFFLQTVITDPAKGAPDPQTALHADTFHPTAKLWWFLTDVGEDDGPFVFVPGGHALTPARLAWEHAQSLTAAADGKRHHALGSFRISPDGLAELGYGAPKRIAVPANTLVIANTYGFHNRAPSERPTLRVELHGYLRRNPFMPWNGLDPSGLIGQRKIDAFFWWLDMRGRLFGKSSIWKDVGPTRVDGPALS